MRYLFLLVCLLTEVTAIAQTKKPDKIIRKDNTQIEAQVLEITETQVKYRRFSNLDGPLYSINKSELVVIIYANGESEIFGNPGNTTPQGNQYSTPAQRPAAVTSATDGVNNASSALNQPVPERFMDTPEAVVPPPAPPKREKGFFDYYEGGYCRFGNYNESIGGIYMGWALGYRLNRAFSAEALLGYGAYFPDPPAGQIGISKLYTYYVLPKLTYRIHFSKESNAGVFFSGGAGVLATSGEVQDLTQQSSAIYPMDVHAGMGYEIGGGIMFGKVVSLSADYMGADTFGVIKLGLKVGL